MICSKKLASAQSQTRAFQKIKKLYFFKIMTAICAVFLFFIFTKDTKAEAIYYYVDNYESQTTTFECNSFAVKFKAHTQYIRGISFICGSGTEATSYWSMCISSNTNTTGCLTNNATQITCDSSVTWGEPRTAYPFDALWWTNYPLLTIGNYYYAVFTRSSGGGTAVIYGNSNMANGWDTETWNNDTLITNKDLSLWVFGTTTPPAETSTTTPAGDCPDCTNNCFCGSTAGATTSTSTILADSFLRDNDISTIKSVSGAVGDKNYTIYYLPVILFLYIFAILFICLVIIYIFKRLKRKN